MDELTGAAEPEDAKLEQDQTKISPEATAVYLQALDGTLDETRLLDNEKAAPDQETVLLDDETRLLNDETTLLDQETTLLESETQLLERDESPEEQDSEPAPEADATQAAAVPGVIPIDETLLRPLPKEEQDRYVRRTRDYDHDAQSVNTVAGSENFDTIQDRSSRKVWRDPYARSKRKGRVPGEGNSRSKLRPLLAIIVIALVLGAAGAVLTYGMELWGGKTVPTVVGESQAYAEATLGEKGFTVVVEAEPGDDAIGKVVSQDPQVGTRLPEGSKVTIVVATNRTMPEVVGLKEDEARALLAEAGAELIETTTKPSSEEEGTVIAVSPEAGKPFVSRNPVKLTVAGPYTVPDVIGKKESDAVSDIKGAGLNAEVSYVNSDKTVRTVIETSPAAGETIEEGGTVQVKVSSPYPSSAEHLAEFFGHSSQDVDTYLQKQGYAFQTGFIDNSDNAAALYGTNESGKITFTSKPWLRSLETPKKGSSNVMATGTPFAGVRLDFPQRQVPGSTDRAAVEELVELCGFGDIEDICDSQSLVLNNSASFTCASGTMGDDLVWTVLVTNDGGMRASATCARRSVYSDSDLQPYGGSVCQFMAAQELYHPAEQKSDEKKDDQKKDEKSNDNAQQ